MSTNPNSNISKEARKDILELDEKIKEFNAGKIPEDKFKLFRLTRGVYGQRQLGVQMIRIKIPYGKITSKQLKTIAATSDKFSNGNLHLTTRQDIQLHYVKVEESPALWADLEESDITLREACGNTVRNITASAVAGIDPNELFDVSPYAQKLFEFFLRNPICQEMGRKFKIALSSSDDDSAFTYFHDLGLIPRVQTVDGVEKKGFKVLIAGGLGALSMIAYTAYEFLPEEEVLPFAEALVRVFDRHGERTSRNKARMKFLAKKIGAKKIVELVEEERKALQAKVGKIEIKEEVVSLPAEKEIGEVKVLDEQLYKDWLVTNVFEQKQKGYYGVYALVPLGNFSSDTARELSDLIKEYAGDDIRVTVDQNLLFKYIKKEALPVIFNKLYELNLAQPGFNSAADITACPGTDTCNLGVSNSTVLSVEIEKMIRKEYHDLVFDSQVKFKISGCMNSCGQHMAANIGFHGSSIKKGALVIPAMQVVIGGGVDPSGKGFVAEKVIKLPSKKIIEAIRWVLNDFEDKKEEGEYFNDYFYRLGKRYFYDLLKPLADTSELVAEDFVDWGDTEEFKLAIGVGECAGVMYDMIGLILKDAETKISLAKEAIGEGHFADAIYHAYNIKIIAAKALLLSDDVKCNTQIGIIRDFDKHFVSTGKFKFEGSFEEDVLQLNKQEPSKKFAESYLERGVKFFEEVLSHRKKQIQQDKNQEGKLVIDEYYKA
ncbi:MAG: HEPN domain-containing protein [Flammeovirgaceae bacterium]|nr:HEPN domain-containing protein [Flammeovirgaceae bacterium]